MTTGGVVEDKVQQHQDSEEKRYNTSDRTNLSIQEAVRQVTRAIQEVEYGEIIVKMQGGKPIWVDKYERKRVG